MKNTMKAVLIAAFAAALMAQETAKPKPESKPELKVEPKTAALTELELTKIENVSLREALLSKQAEDLTSQKNALVKDICARAKIEVTSCSVDPQGKTVRETAPPPKK